MVGQRQLIHKGLMMAKIEREFNILLKIIEKQDKKVEELEGKFKVAQKNRVDLANAYAQKTGVIVSKKSKTSKQIIKKEIERRWEKGFLKTLNSYAMEINEHNLIEAIEQFGERVYKEART